MTIAKVSVLLPTFNDAMRLEQAINSIRTQSLSDLELIVIDDGSTDQSEQLIADIASKDRRIRVLRQNHEGIAGALNNGIGVVQSQFMARMDSDDVSYPERLRLQLSFLEKHPEVAALGSWAYVIDENGRIVGELEPETEPQALRLLLARQNPFIHSSMMLSTALVRRLGGYRKVLDGAEDYDLWLRISEHALLANLPEFLISHRRHSASASATANTKQLLSARLARMSAAQRRAGKPDFINTLHAPLNLKALSGQKEMRATADIYGLLGESPQKPLAAHALHCLWHIKLTHAERKAMQIWLRDARKSNTGYFFRTLALFWLFWLHPPRALSLVWSTFKDQDRS